MSEYKLSTVLIGHSVDVRAVDVGPDGYILSGSRDKTAKLWKPNGFNTGYTDSITYKGHQNYVSAVCFLAAMPEHPNGLVVTGGNDSLICVYEPDDAEPKISVKGHTNTVCNLSKANNAGCFLSSSWDCTAKLWCLSGAALKELVTFTGHQAAVWACIQLPNGNVASASADKDVIVWAEDGRKLHLLKGHTDCVRGLASLGETFLSVSNDASVKQWTVDGQCLQTLYGHGNYIYSVSADDDGVSFATAGEDRALILWRGDKNVQTLTLPAQSVWCVSYLRNGDIVTGSSDGVVRIFTKDPSRYADETTLKIFEEEVTSLSAASSQEIGGVKITDLPGPEILYEAGRRDGQTKLVREGATVICYTWSAAEGRWNKVGDVMGAAGGTAATSGRTLHEGKEYDFVFSVDIEDGKPPIKLPYNKDEDPWFAAQEFIHKHSLPQAYLEQVANFIIKNSGAVPAVPSRTSEFMDPFTGSSRYMPTASGSSISVSGSNLDPFTGSQSYTTSTNSAQAPAVTNYFPQTTYLKFDQGNVQVILEKMKELNRKSGNPNSMDEVLLEEVVRLAQVQSCDSLYTDALIQLLNWPSDIVFPILDIARLAVRYPEPNASLCSQVNSDYFLQLLRKYINNDNVANKMLSLRILCNLFSHPPGETLVIKNKTVLLNDIRAQDPNLNKHTQIALLTFLLNLSVATIKAKDFSNAGVLVETLVEAILKVSDPEAEFRGFVALGTLLTQLDAVYVAQIVSSIDSIAKLKEKLSEISNQHSSDSNQLRNMSCASQLNGLLL